jgi:hypothetical protein
VPVYIGFYTCYSEEWKTDNVSYLQVDKETNDTGNCINISLALGSDARTQRYKCNRRENKESASGNFILYVALKDFPGVIR